MRQNHQNKNFYGRRKSHKLSKLQQELFENLLPKLSINIEFEDDRSASIPIDLQKLFSSPFKEIWLEIGFGGGEHLIWQAKNHPDIGFIGCEPYLDGVAKLLSQISEHNLTNIKIYNDDATHLINNLPKNSISKIFLLYPDPWPKKRHNKRRFINHTTIEIIKNILTPKGIFHFSSDIEDYVFWCLKHFQKHQEFLWLANKASDWRQRAEDWPQTRYEIKALDEGRKPAYLKFQKQ